MTTTTAASDTARTSPAPRDAAPRGAGNAALAPAPVQTWVKIALVALAVPNVLTGLWAVLAPASWFDRFPGWDPRLIAAEPPFNAHLATDAGAGLLASGVVLLLAAWLADRRSVLLGLAAFATFAVPHAAYHVLNPAPGMTGSENLQNATVLVVTLAAVVAVAVAVVRGARREA